MRTRPRCENCATSASASTRTTSASAKATRSRPTTAGALSELDTVPSSRECRVDGVEAVLPRRRGKFYPGKIMRDRGDDTYEIGYDYGDRETRVSKRLIRRPDGRAICDNLKQAWTGEDPRK